MKIFFRGIALCLCAASVYYSVRLVEAHNARYAPPPPMSITKEILAKAFEPSLARGEFPLHLNLEYQSKTTQATVRYTLDEKLQSAMFKIFQSYRPDYGAFVALDAETGRILSLISYHRPENPSANLALQATFPVASIFKIVTAAAAIDEGKLSPDSVIPFRGSNHTLYRKNVTEEDPRKLGRHMTLREAFAKSVNTVFGRVGVFILKPFQLQRYAEKFHFNRAISGDLPIGEGKISIPDTDPWAVAEIASGFTREAQMSPVHGAMIASAIANDGVMMEPYIVETLTNGSELVLYNATPKRAATVISSASALELRGMMRATVFSGTSRKAFRDLLRRPYARKLDIGGKTGSLQGMSPRGKYDWFVGYANGFDRKIAVAALTINEDLWRVKSSYLARYAFEQLFKSAELAKK